MILFTFIILIIIAIIIHNGLKCHSLIGSLISYHRNRHRLLDWYTDLLAASPSHTITLTRLGARRTIITSNPSNVEHILNTNFPNYPKGKPFTDILDDLLGRGIFNSDGHLWLSQRKIASHAFTPRSLRHLIHHILLPEISHHFLPSLIPDGRTVTDLQNLLCNFSFRVVCHMFVGPLSADLSQLEKAMDVASAISARRGSAPIALLWKVKRALRIGSEKRLREAVDLVRRLVTEIVTKNPSSSLLSHILAKGRIFHGEDEEIAVRDMVISFLMAGKDTTSSPLTWFSWLISTHPEVEEKIINELKLCIKSEEEDMSYEWLKVMKYLEASLMEAMRLYPPVAWDSKHAVSDDVLPDGTVIRKGDRVTYFPYGMGRMEGIWGEDWREYRPERWAGELMKVSPYKFPVFQAGPRVCLGREMAMIQMKLVAATVLRRFKLMWVGRGMPVIVPLFTAHMVGGLPVVVLQRGV